ncbi:hypothetical protein RB628_21115 [Streptomyces sp. ADMS]|uniref:hypothetical protein n=1 Tax=Streptomyces sp. ADMS TaxID=3071415 RepID=UPI00296F57FD|nr:hypothetical protein [Streptomyces sp. ADMS]MDW4907782.1 hypothetical protein [Streptomyces sp. ADMS]
MSRTSWPSVCRGVRQAATSSSVIRRIAPIRTRPATGRHADDGGLFATSCCAEPTEVPAEFSEAGLVPEGQYGLAGVAWLMGGAEQWLDAP